MQRKSKSLALGHKRNVPETFLNPELNMSMVEIPKVTSTAEPNRLFFCISPVNNVSEIVVTLK